MTSCSGPGWSKVSKTWAGANSSRSSCRGCSSRRCSLRTRIERGRSGRPRGRNGCVRRSRRGRSEVASAVLVGLSGCPRPTGAPPRQSSPPGPSHVRRRLLMTYVRRRPDLSWHIFRTWSRVPGRAVSLCGRRIEAAETSDTFGDDRTCETCWRAKGRADAAPDTGNEV